MKGESPLQKRWSVKQMKNRSVAAVVVLSLITCGIYAIYWIVVTTNDIEHSLKAPDGHVKSGGMTILLSIVTCGVYLFYWWYKQGQRVAQIQRERGLNVIDNSVAYLILSIFCLTIVSMGLMQSAINQIVGAIGENTGNV